MDFEQVAEPVRFRQALGPTIRAVTGIALAILVVVAVARVLAGAGVSDMVFFLIAAAYLVAVLRMRLVTTISAGGVNVHGWFGLLNTTIAAEEITGAAVGPTTTWMEGVGVRFHGNAQGFIVGGPTMEIQRRTAPYLVSVPDPGAAVAAVERLVLRR